MKSGVTKACYYDPELNRSVMPTWPDHYGTVILPTRTYRPRDKAAVEAGVQVVERWVLAPLRNRQFFSLAELNKAISQKVAELNDRAFRGEPTSRRELFEELERPALKPLPAKRYELAEWKKVTVNIDYHVEYSDSSGRHYYSVPYTLVRQKLELRATVSTVEVYKGGRRVASHAREYGRRRYVTDPAHMPPSHRAHLEWTPSRLVEWARTVSPHAAALAEKILASRPHPEHSYRACLGPHALAKRYGNERLGAACQRALASRGHLLHLGQVDPGPEPRPGGAPAALGGTGARPSTRTCAVPAITPRKRRPERMFANQTIDKLEALGLHAMAAGLPTNCRPGHLRRARLRRPAGPLVDKEADARDSRRLAARLKAAKLRYPAAVEDIDFEPRGASTARSSWAWPRGRG